MPSSASYTVLTPAQHQSEQEADMDNGETDDGAPSVEPLPFNVEDSFTDVVLQVEDQPLYTNRSLLAYASPVFACMFTSEFKEKSDKVINLPGKSYLAITEMLAFLHPGVTFNLTRDSAFRLLPLAEEYQISVLKKSCEQCLIEDVKNLLFPYDGFLLPCLVAAETTGLSKLQDMCIDKMSEPDTSLKELKVNTQISLETKSKIYEMRIDKLEKDRGDVDSWKQRVNCAKQRLRDIVLPHEEHCRCHVELKLRSFAQRSCSYCTRTWCSDNISTEAYRNSYQFYCSHKIGYHIAHDATLRSFMEMVEFPL